MNSRERDGRMKRNKKQGEIKYLFGWEGYMDKKSTWAAERDTEAEETRNKPRRRNREKAVELGGIEAAKWAQR